MVRRSGGSEPAAAVDAGYLRAGEPRSTRLDWYALGKGSGYPALRLALAGSNYRTAPRLEALRARCSELCNGVREAVEWLPVVDNLGYRIPVEPTLTFLPEERYARNGNPGDYEDHQRLSRNREQRGDKRNR